MRSRSSGAKRPANPPASNTMSSDAMRLTPLVASPAAGVSSNPKLRASSAHARKWYRAVSTTTPSRSNIQQRIITSKH